MRVSAASSLYLENFGVAAVVTAASLAGDYDTLAATVRQYTPAARVAGADIAFQIPVLGEITHMYPECVCAFLFCVAVCGCLLFGVFVVRVYDLTYSFYVCTCVR